MEKQLYILNSLAMTHRDLTSDLKDLSDLSTSGYRILLNIGESKQGVRITEIADELGFKFTSVAATVEILVQRGLVERSDDPEDKRAFHLNTTQKGTQLISKIDAALIDKLKKRWAPLDKRQLEVILVDLDTNHLTSEYITSIAIPFLTAEAVLKKKRLTLTQFLILLLLAVKGSQRPRDIARGLDQKPATISVALNNLEKGGFITRSRAKEDRSSTNTELTPEGLALAREMAEAIQKEFDSFTHRSYSQQDVFEFDSISKLVVEASTQADTLDKSED